MSTSTAAEAVTKIAEAEKSADLIEIRFDHLNADEVPRLLDHLRAHHVTKPLIATYRSSEQGGREAEGTASRREFWEQLGDGFWAVDQEEDVFNPHREPNHILSYHNFGSGAENADQVFERLRAQKPSIVKYAFLAHDITDTIPVWKTLKTAEALLQPAVLIAMGEAGKITRILGPAHGSQWTYGSIGNQTAPGQISLGDLIDLYRVREIDCDTKVYGVIGDPVASSLSPVIHNAAIKAAQIDSVFLPILVKDLREFIDRMVRPTSREVDLNFAGFAVTMPHKLSIIDHLDGIDETARTIGAVNTIRIDGDAFRGYNTDAEGFIKPLLKRLGSLKGSRVAIIGAGGAARACLYALKKEGAAAVIFARDPKKGKALAEEFGSDSNALDGAAIGSFDIVVNATPVGMAWSKEAEAPFALMASARTKLVYDLVTAAPTPFIRKARALGFDTIEGVEMLVAQAERQFEIWTGKSAPVDVMREAAKMSTE